MPIRMLCHHLCSVKLIAFKFEVAYNFMERLTIGSFKSRWKLEILQGICDFLVVGGQY